MNPIKKRAMLAQEALTARLFVPGWDLSYTLAEVKSQPKDFIIRLHYEDNMPVGVAVRDKRDGCIEVFVKVDYRRKGIGSKLVQKVKDVNSYGTYGVIGSPDFWRANSVRYVD